MTVEQRIATLEARLRILTRTLGGILVIGSVALLAGAAQNANQETVRAKQIEIVDGNGNVRIRLGQADEGYGLIVYDENGKFNATVTDAPLGAAISLSKGDGGIRLVAGKDGSGLSVKDEKGRPRAMVQVLPDQSRIVLKDPQNATVFSAPSDE